MLERIASGHTGYLVCPERLRLCPISPGNVRQLPLKAPSTHSACNVRQPQNASDFVLPSYTNVYQYIE